MSKPKAFNIWSYWFSAISSASSLPFLFVFSFSFSLFVVFVVSFFFCLLPPVSKLKERNSSFVERGVPRTSFGEGVSYYSVPSACEFSSPSSSSDSSNSN
jgi:hypothetical protein